MKRFKMNRRDFLKSSSFITGSAAATGLFVADNPEIDRDLLVEIDQLDSTYQMLKSAADGGQSEKIIDAMVLNLQMRIDILNQQLEVLEKIKTIKENENISI